MRRLTAFVCLTLAVLLFSATEGFALPPCPTDRHTSTWTDCFGTYTFRFPADGTRYVGEFRDGKRHGQGTGTNVIGDKYVGEWRDNKRHGQGTYTFANGNVREGVWENGTFQYGKKLSPTVTADKAPESRVAEEKRRAEAERLVEEVLQRALKEEERRERFATLTRGLVAADVVAAIVNDGVKLRALPEPKAEVVKQLAKGRQVQVTGVLPNGWLQISEEGEPVGWVFKTAVPTEAIAAPSPAAPPTVVAAPRPEVELEPLDAPYRVTTAANVRAAPDVTADRVSGLREGERVTALGKVRGKDWYLVERDGEWRDGHTLTVTLVAQSGDVYEVFEKRLRIAQAVDLDSADEIG